MVYQNCTTRRLEPEGFFTFKTEIRVIQPRPVAAGTAEASAFLHPDKAKSTFALWIASNRSWMVEDAPLSEYTYLKAVRFAVEFFAIGKKP
jgi:hypothetical protein